MKRLVIVIGLMLASTMGIAVTTTAQSDWTPEVQFTTYPVGEYQNRWIQIEVSPGETVALTAGVMNKGNAPVSLRAFIANAGNIANGGFSASTESDPLAGQALWLDFSAESFSLAPGVAREWDFTVSVPEGTPSGQYVAALVVQTDEDLQVAGSEIFDQVLRSAMAIEITVPGGATPGFVLGDPEVVTGVLGSAVEIPVTNTGNVIVKPMGELVMVNSAGEAVTTLPIRMGSVYPGTTVLAIVPLAGQLLSGDDEIRLTLVDPQTGAAATFP